MNNEQYLNEAKYQNTKNKVSNVGKVLLIIGICTIVLGIILIIFRFGGIGKTVDNSINSINTSSTVSGIFGNFGLIVGGGFVIFIGFCLLMAGGITMLVSHRREITSFTVQGTMPIAKEGINTIAPAVGNIAESISKGIEKGKIQAREEYENK